jgi:hypothetical protein
VDEALRVLEGQASQEEIVDKTEDRGVQSDAERKRTDRDESEGGRLPKFAKGKAEVVRAKGLRE